VIVRCAGVLDSDRGSADPVLGVGCSLMGFGRRFTRGHSLGGAIVLLRSCSHR
jgi:hypothetical protein